MMLNKAGNSLQGPLAAPRRRTVNAARTSLRVSAAKELHFNRDGAALKRMQQGADKLAAVVGVTLGPKGRNVVLESKFGSPKIVNDGVTVAKEVELEDPVENIGSKLVRQAAQKTNDAAGDGTTTATVLAAALIAEGMKVVVAGANPVQVTRGMAKTVARLVEVLKTLSQVVVAGANLVQVRQVMGKTVAHLVEVLKTLSQDLNTDDELANVATVSAGNDKAIGGMICSAMQKVGRQGVVTMEESRTAEDNLYVVEGMQFERGFVSPYFVTDPERMIAEYENCNLLLIDKKVSTARELVGLLEQSIRSGNPLLIMAEDFEQEPLATLVVNKLRGNLKVIAVKAPGFGERKTSYLEDIAIMTGATLVKDELGVTLETATEEVFGMASKVSVGKESCTIVAGASYQKEIEARVAQIKNLISQTDQAYEIEKLNERVARLSGGVAVLQVGASTETELKEKKLRVEDALNATKAAVEEGIVIGGGCTLLRLAGDIESIKGEVCDNEEQKMGADIVKKALPYALKLIAHNAGVNGSVVMDKVLRNKDNVNFGYNAATDTYEDLMQAGIIDPTKVIRCCLENATSVARTFLMADCIVTEIPEPEEAGPGGAGMEMGGY